MLGVLTANEQAQLVAYPIDFTGITTSTIMTPAAGRKWVLYYLVTSVSAATNLQLLSAATAVSGVKGIIHGAAGTMPLTNGGIPLAVGKAAGDTFQIASDTAVDVDGWALIGEVPA